MLILTRPVGKKIIIGHDITIQVVTLDFKRQEVSLGIEAPKDISVHREEIYKLIQKENHNR